MKNRILATLVILATATFYANADTYMIDGVKYNAEMKSCGSGCTAYYAYITGYDSRYIPEDGYVVLQDRVMYYGYKVPVIYIKEGAFRNCTTITSITLPNTISDFNDSYFYGCSNLTSITIGAEVKTISINAFRGIPNLHKVMVDSANTTYDSRDNCSGVIHTATNTLVVGRDSTTIPNSVTSIGESAFYGCTGLTSIIIPNSVTNIGGSAFSGCTGLASITIPNSVTSIGESAFKNCTGLTSVTIGKSVTSIGSSAFYGCTGLTSVTIPESVANIGSSAFDGCSNLETVEFGENVQDIGINAFYGCQNIYEITVRATKVPNVVAEGTYSNGNTYGTFYGVSKLAELHVPAESVKKYKIHPVWGLFNVITAIPCVVTLHCDNVMGAVTGAGSYQANEQVNITATPNLGYRFRQWSDGITTNPRTLVVVGDTTLTAEFEEIPASEYTVSVVVDAEQNGAVQMTLIAVPDDGYQFAQWSDGNTDNPRTILVTENMTLSATFSVATNAAATPTHDDTNGTRKVFRNGHVLIQHGNKTYTTTGIEVK